jgi:uncharacterized membrane protein
MERNDQRMDRAIAEMLRFGVILAASVVLSGGVWYLLRSGLTVPSYRTFHSEPPDLRSVVGVLRGVAALRPRRLIQFGLLLLIANPIARVAFSAVTFALRRDRAYTAITLTVLAVLIGSLTGLVAPPR